MYVKKDYKKERKLLYIIRRHTLWTNVEAQNGSYILHMILANVNKLLV